MAEQDLSIDSIENSNGAVMDGSSSFQNDQGDQTQFENLSQDINSQAQQYEQINSQQVSPNITNEDRFYGARRPIQRGTTASGVPIFVANQPLTPFGILDKREQAIEEAKRKRQERQAKFKLDRLDRLKNANYQKMFDQAFVDEQNRYIKEAKAIYGDDWDVALGSDSYDVGRRYKQSLSNFQTLKDQADAFTTKAADIKARIEAGDASVSEKTAQLVKDTEAAIGQFAEGNPVDLVGKMDQLQASVNIDDWLNKNIMPNLKAIQSKRVSGLISDGEYKRQITNEIRSINSQADAIAKRLKKPNGAFGFDPNIQEKDISDAIKQRIGNYSATSSQTIDKPSKSKAKYTEEALSNRLEKINALSDPFKGGDSETPTIESKKFISDLVGAKYNDRIIKGAEIIKGGEDQDLINSVNALFSYNDDSDNESAIKESIKKGSGKLIDKDFSFKEGDKIISGTVSNIDFDEDDNNAYVLMDIKTPSGVVEKKYNISKPEGSSDWEEIRDGFKVSYPDKPDRVVLSLDKKNRSDRETEAVIDLTKPGTKYTFNTILNTSGGEVVDIPTPDLQILEQTGIQQGANQLGVPNKNNQQPTSPKQEKPVSSVKEYTQSEIEALAKQKNTTVENLIKWAKQNKNLTIVIK